MKLGIMSEGIMSEQVKFLGTSIKTASAVLALMAIFSQQPANAELVDVDNEEFCYKYSTTSYGHDKYIRFVERIITCEGGIAYTTIGSSKGKSVKYDETGKPQKCECVWGEKIIKHTFSNDEYDKVLKTILLDDGLGKDKNTTKK